MLAHHSIDGEGNYWIGDVGVSAYEFKQRVGELMCPVDAPVDVPSSNEQSPSLPSDLLPLLQGIAALVETQRELTKSILALAQSQSEMARAMSEDQGLDLTPMSTKR